MPPGALQGAVAALAVVQVRPAGHAAQMQPSRRQRPIAAPCNSTGTLILLKPRRPQPTFSHAARQCRRQQRAPVRLRLQLIERSAAGSSGLQRGRGQAGPEPDGQGECSPLADPARPRGSPQTAETSSRSARGRAPCPAAPGCSTAAPPDPCLLRRRPLVQSAAHPLVPLLLPCRFWMSPSLRW